MDLRPPSPRATVLRRSGRARYDRAAIKAILDEGLVAHVGLSDREGQPYVIPVVYGRGDEQVYLHGSVLSRLLATLADSFPVCFTVTLLDGLVLARSAFHHSLNYRSVVILGQAHPVRDASEKRAALRAVVEHVTPGRSADVRGPSDSELAATEVVALGIDEASAKIRTGGPVDAPEDYALATWAGTVPLALVPGAPITDPRCELPPPSYLRPYGRDADSRAA